MEKRITSLLITVLLMLTILPSNAVLSFADTMSGVYDSDGKFLAPIAEESANDGYAMEFNTDASATIEVDDYILPKLNQIDNLTSELKLFTKQAAETNVGVKAVAAGQWYSATVKTDGSLWTWGDNRYGQLGDKTNSDKYSPMKIMDNVVSVATGAFHSIAIKTDGSLWAWGNNNSGEIGDGTIIRKFNPVRIMDDVNSVAAGSGSSLAVKSDNSLWAWGNNSIYNYEEYLIPVKIMDNVNSATTNGGSSFAIKMDGSLWAWGVNNCGQLGDGTITDKLAPVKIMDNVNSVVTKGNHAFAIKTDGSLWAWGDNYYGQLGNGEQDNEEHPIPMKIMDNVNSVVAERYHNIAIKTDGSLWVWGYNFQGALGDSNVEHLFNPTKIMNNASSAAVGSCYSLVIKSDGSLWAWGDNYYGQLGDGTIVDRPTPVKIMDGNGSGGNAGSGSSGTIPSTIQIGNPMPDFDTVMEGPAVNFWDRDFNIFSLDTKTEYSFLGETIKLEYDEAEKKYVGAIGFTSDAIDDYKKLKKLMKIPISYISNQIEKKRGWMGFEGNVGVYGYVTFLPDSNGNLLLSESEVGIILEGEKSFYALINPPATFFKFKLGGEVDGRVKWILQDAGDINGGFKFDGGSLDVKGKLAAGIEMNYIIVKAGGGVEGSIKLELTFPKNRDFKTQQDLKAKLTASVYLQGEVLFLFGAKTKWDFLDYQLYPKMGFQSFAQPMVMDFMPEDDIRLIDRDYINMPSQFVANIQERSLIPTSDRMIKTNIFPNTKTQVLDLGNGKQLLIWLDDVGAVRSPANRTALYYSVFDGGSWSSPDMIDDDGTADFDFRAAAIGDDVYVIWQNAEQIFSDDVKINDVVKHLGIKAASYDGNTFISETLTVPDDTLKFLPQIVTDNENLIAAWIENTENDINCATGINRVYYSIGDGDTWSNLEVAVDIDDAIMTLNFEYDNGVPVIVYSVGEAEQEEIYLIRENASAVQITDNDVKDTHPVLVKTADGIDLYWYSGDSIVYAKDLEFDDVETVVAEVPYANNFSVVDTLADSLIYWENADGFQNSIAGVLRSGDDSWTDPVLFADAGGHYRGTSGYMKADGSILFAYAFSQRIDAEIVGVGTEDGNSPFGETSLMISELSPAYDLAMTSDVFYDYMAVEQGGELPVYYHVANIGTLPVSHMVVQILDDENHVIAEKVESVDLKAGSVFEGEIAYSLPDPLQQHSIKIKVMPYSDGSFSVDRQESDNTAVLAVGHTQVMVLSPTLSGEGDSRTLDVVIANEGYAASDEITLNLYLGDYAIPVVAENIGRLQAGEHIPYTTSVNIESLNFTPESDDVLLYVVATWESENGEAVETNNALIHNPYRVETSLDYFGTVLYQTSNTLATIDLLDSGGTLIDSTNTAADGTYTLTAPVGGGYTLVITKQGYLSYTIKNLELVDGEAIETIDIRQLAGEIDGDGYVNSVDLTYLLSEFGRAPANYPFADIDGDGIANSVDLTYLLAGFNKSNVIIDKLGR